MWHKESICKICAETQISSPAQIFQIEIRGPQTVSTYHLEKPLLLLLRAPTLPSRLSSSELPSYSPIIRAGGPDQSWHCHSPSQSLAQSFLLPEFCSLPPTSLKLPTKDFFSLNLETGHWICQLLSLRIFLLIFFFSCLIRRLPDYCMAHGESTVEKMGSAPAGDTIWISMRVDDLFTLASVRACGVKYLNATAPIHIH